MRTILKIVGLSTLLFAGTYNPALAQEHGADNLAIRLTGPSHFEVNPENFDFYMKCEISNNGKGDIAVLQRARIYLLDESGETHRCLRYNDGVYPSPVLRPGETTTWWQHGITPRDGTFKAHVRWGEEEDLRSAAVPISMTFSSIQTDQVEEIRNQRLQEKADTFVKLVPNTLPAEASFTNVVFANDPIIVHGRLYSCFSFVTPEQEGDLLWSFVVQKPERNRVNWYIIPDEGSMEGFSTFYVRALSRDIAGTGNKGDKALFQHLPRSRLAPNRRYLMWFESMYRDIPSVTVSLNVFDEAPPFWEVFPEVHR